MICKAGPVPGNFRCSQRKCIRFFCLSIKWHSQTVFQLQVFILLVTNFWRSACDLELPKFKHQLHQIPGTEFSIWVYWVHIWKHWPRSLIFNLRFHALFLTVKTRPSLNRLRLRIKGTSTRVLFRRSARWITLAALLRKVFCTLPWSITPHLPPTALRLLIPLRYWKYSSCANISALYLSATSSSMTKVLCTALLLCILYLHRQSVFCHLVLIIFTHKRLSPGTTSICWREMLIWSVSECLPEEYIWPFPVIYLWNNAFLSTLNKFLLYFVLLPEILRC